MRGARRETGGRKNRGRHSEDSGEGGRISDYVDVEIMCDNLSDRKQLMEGDTRGQICAQLSAEDYDGRQEVTRRGVIARVITSIVFSLEVISITPNRN